MKQICLYCERTISVANLWCQETYCPAEQSPYILDSGENLGDIEIVKVIAVLRTSALYEATHHEEKIFLKVSHPGEQNKKRLQREAELLASLAVNDDTPEFLPKLKPPYLNASLQHTPYGRITLQGQLLYYVLFEFSSGEPLRDTLAKTPQLWVQHVAQITMTLSLAVNYLHSLGYFHLMLSPDVILITFDNKSPYHARIILFDLGIISNAQEITSNWQQREMMPAYIAPELLKTNGRTKSPAAADIYGIGLILQEMLNGNPTYAFKLSNDSQVKQLVNIGKRDKRERIDILNLPNLATSILVDEPSARRPVNAIDIHNSLIQDFEVVPPKPRNWWPDTQTILAIVVAFLAIAILVALSVNLNADIPPNSARIALVVAAVFATVLSFLLRRYWFTTK